MGEYLDLDDRTRKRAIVGAVAGATAGFVGSLVPGDAVQRSIFALFVGIAVVVVLLLVLD